MKSTELRIRRRRGAIYAVVLLTATAVSIVGVSAVIASRHVARRLTDSHDFAAARRNALSGLDYAIFRISNDPNWRTTLQGSSWTMTMPIGEGEFETVITDPHDNNVLNNATDPIRIESTGTQRNSTHITQVELNFPPDVSPLGSALHAGGSLTLTDAKLSAAGIVSANGNITASNSRVTAEVESAGTAGGTTYVRTPKSGAAARAMPSAASILAAYEPSATSIPITSVSYPPNPELIQNGGMEQGTSQWNALNTADIASDNGQYYTGAASLFVTNRTASNAGAQQNIRADLANSGPGNYRLTGWVKSATSTARSFRATLSWQYTAFSSNTINGLGPTTGNTWAFFDATFNGVNFSPPSALSAASIQIYTGTGTTNFYLDDFSLKKVGVSGERTINGQILTPANNPWGSPDSAGLYVIDCNNESLVIRDSRIVGTLILKRPGPNTRIEGGMVWETASKDQPILIVDGNIQINIQSPKLRELALDVNLNPTGLPYRYEGGSADADKDDRYDSKLHGLVYVSGNLAISGTTSMQGVVLAGGNVTVASQVLNLVHDDVYASNPPPGFGAQDFKPWIVGGSFMRVVR